MFQQFSIDVAIITVDWRAFEGSSCVSTNARFLNVFDVYFEKVT
jgi:hypothetical protein